MGKGKGPLSDSVNLEGKRGKNEVGIMSFQTRGANSVGIVMAPRGGKKKDEGRSNLWVFKRGTDAAQEATARGIGTSSSWKEGGKHQCRKTSRGK